MNERRLHDLLDQIAQKEIPEDMNLWNAIQTRIEALPQSGATRPAFRISKWILLAAILMIVSATAYGVYQITHYGGDEGIMTVGAANLITDLNLTQSLESADVNITLEWAYADGHRISIGWLVDYAATLDMPYLANITLMDQDGSVFGPAEFLHGGGGGGGGGNGREMMGSSSSFDATHITDNPEQLELKVILDFSGPIATENRPTTFNEDGTVATYAPRTPVEPFQVEFEFDVPFLPAVPIPDIYSAEVNGTTVTVKDLSYAPSITLGTLCYTNPQDQERYYPELTFGMNQFYRGSSSFYISDEAAYEADPVCGDLTLFGGIASEPESLKLVIPSLKSYTYDVNPDTVTAFETEMKAQGYDIELQAVEQDNLPRKGEGGMEFVIGNDQATNLFYFYNINNKPEMLAEGYYLELQNLQDRFFRSMIDGPWEFQIVLPE